MIPVCSHFLDSNLFTEFSRKRPLQNRILNMEFFRMPGFSTSSNSCFWFMISVQKQNETQTHLFTMCHFRSMKRSHFLFILLHIELNLKKKLKKKETFDKSMLVTEEIIIIIIRVKFNSRTHAPCLK